MKRNRPSASTTVLVERLMKQIDTYQGDLGDLSFRDRILRLIEVQEAVRQLGIALAVDAGLSKSSARERVKAYLRGHLGQVIEGKELAAVSGISEYARRARDLRKEVDVILLTGPATHPQTGKPLRPDQYMLVCTQS